MRLASRIVANRCIRQQTMAPLRVMAKRDANTKASPLLRFINSFSRWEIERIETTIVRTD